MRKIDLTGVECPMNFVRTKLALEEMEAGEVLEVLLDAGEPMHNVPKSVIAEGHRVIVVEPDGDQYVIQIEKNKPGAEGDDAAPSP